MNTIVSDSTFEDGFTLVSYRRPTRKALEHAHQPRLVPTDEFSACYVSPTNDNHGWLDLAKLVKSKPDVAKMIVRAIVQRWKADEREQLYRSPQMGLLYALRLQVILRACLTNDKQYKAERSADYSLHLGRAVGKSDECRKIMSGFDQALTLQAKGDPSYIQVFTETDKMFWQLRYNRWQAVGAPRRVSVY